jgi:hypothetical protein
MLVHLATLILYSLQETFKLQAYEDTRITCAQFPDQFANIFRFQFKYKSTQLTTEGDQIQYNYSWLVNMPNEHMPIITVADMTQQKKKMRKRTK